MRIQYSNTIILIADWILVALALVIPSWFLSRWGQKKGILKFLMLWSFFNFSWLLAYMLFSRDPFAIFAIFHVLVFGLLFLIFYLWWKLEGDKKNSIKTIKQLKLLYKCP